MASHFPKDIQDQQYLTVSAIPAGFFYLPDRQVFDDSLESDTGQKVPSLSFLLEHNTYGRILFDLGNRKVLHATRRSTIVSDRKKFRVEKGILRLWHAISSCSKSTARKTS